MHHSEIEALRLKSNTLAPSQEQARAGLLYEVLGLTAAPSTATPWTPFALFGPTDLCVAALDAAVLPLIVDGADATAGAIRAVAVDPAWRGKGLFRRLMTVALAWCDAHACGPTLLFTEEPGLYGRFGFREIAEHAFVGPAPAARPAAPARRLDLGSAADRDLVATLVGKRTPVSSQVALHVDAAQLLANLDGDAEWSAACLDAPETVVVYADEGDEFVLADLIGPQIPDLASVLGALGRPAARIKTMFPPDRIAWHGKPVAEDAGLMIRGATPAAMCRSFMLPPTAEF